MWYIRITRSGTLTRNSTLFFLVWKYKQTQRLHCGWPVNKLFKLQFHQSPVFHTRPCFDTMYTTPGLCLVYKESNMSMTLPAISFCLHELVTELRLCTVLTLADMDFDFHSSAVIFEELLIHRIQPPTRRLVYLGIRLLGD